MDSTATSLTPGRSPERAWRLILRNRMKRCCGPYPAPGLWCLIRRFELDPIAGLDELRYRQNDTSAAANSDILQEILSGNVTFLDVSAILDLLRLNDTGAWVRQSVGWINAAVVGLVSAAGISVAFVASVGSAILKLYKIVHERTMGRASSLVRYVSFGLSLLSFGLLILGFGNLSGMELFAVDMLGVFLAMGGFAIYVIESAKPLSKATDVLSSIAAPMEQIVAFTAPFVGGLKFLEHGLQGKYG